MRSIGELTAQAATAGGTPEIRWIEPDDGLLAYVGDTCMGSVFNASIAAEGRLGWMAFGEEGLVRYADYPSYGEATTAACKACVDAIRRHLSAKPA